jgi:mxaJ protein
MFSPSRNRWILIAAACIVAWLAVTWSILAALAQVAGPAPARAAEVPAATPATAPAPAAGDARTPDGLGVPGVLRVAADPNALPFSNNRGEGFENKLAQLVAKDLGLKLEYVWRAQRRGFVRETLKAGTADVMMGTPTSVDMTLNTLPYYRSIYAFVYRAHGPAVRSFDDPRLKQVKVGIPLTGDSAAPVAYALARRGVVDNLVGFPVYADYAQPNPTARVVEAVGSRDVDVAIVWGPLAGYFAPLQKEPLMVAPLQVQKDGDLPMAFNVSMGVARNNKPLKARLDDVIRRHQPEIDKLLDGYNVPRLTITAPATQPQTSGNAAPGKPCDCQ